MIHLNILVEGSTELRFVKAVLAPHLAQGEIFAQMPAYEDDKAHAGPLIAQSIGLPLLRRRCPHFDEWLAKLESLGQRDET